MQCCQTINPIADVGLQNSSTTILSRARILNWAQSGSGNPVCSVLQTGLPECGKIWFNLATLILSGFIRTCLHRDQRTFWFHKNPRPQRGADSAALIFTFSRYALFYQHSFSFHHNQFVLWFDISFRVFASFVGWMPLGLSKRCIREDEADLWIHFQDSLEDEVLYLDRTFLDK